MYWLFCFLLPTSGKSVSGSVRQGFCQLGEGHVWEPREGGLGDGNGFQCPPRWDLSWVSHPRHCPPAILIRQSDLFSYVFWHNVLSKLTLFAEVSPSLRSFPHPECQTPVEQDPICPVTPLCSHTGWFLVYGRGAHKWYFLNECMYALSVNVLQRLIL